MMTPTTIAGPRQGVLTLPSSLAATLTAEAMLAFILAEPASSGGGSRAATSGMDGSNAGTAPGQPWPASSSYAGTLLSALFGSDIGQGGPGTGSDAGSSSGSGGGGTVCSHGLCITLKRQPALPLVVPVPRGAAYKACLAGQGPSPSQPCELGATAWDPILGDVTNKVKGRGSMQLRVPLLHAVLSQSSLGPW